MASLPSSAVWKHAHICLLESIGYIGVDEHLGFAISLMPLGPGLLGVGMNVECGHTGAEDSSFNQFWSLCARA